MIEQNSPLYIPYAVFDPAVIVVYGGGGHGKALLDVIRAMKTYRIVGVVDDHLPAGSKLMGYEVLGSSEILPSLYQQGVHLAVNGVGGIGNVDVRIRAFETLARCGFVCPALVHPSAWVEPGAVLEAGVQVMPQAYIGSDVTIAFGSLVNIGACVSHDAKVGEVVNLSPHAALAGGVVIEDFAQIGMQATVNVGVRVGRRARVGNGATVKADVPAGERVRAGTIWPPPRRSDEGPVSPGPE